MDSSQSKLFLWSLTASLAGFLFGFDTIVISGAEQTIQELWKLSPGQHGFAMSSALIGMVFGSLFGAFPTDTFGRKKVLLAIGLLYFVSAIWSALTNDLYSFAIARFLGGIGVGISTVAAPLYISEISPAAKRGRLAGLFQFSIVFGVLVAYISNNLLSGVGDDGWRWMLGIEALPAVIYSILCLTIPESPRWLLTRKNDRDQGMKILALINPTADQDDLAQIASNIATPKQKEKSSGSLWRSGLQRPILLAFLIAFFNQLSGINAVLYFAPRIFELTGLEKSSALLQTIGIGITNLAFTFVGLWLIDRVGRRTLLIIGSIGYIASLSLCSWAFFAQNFTIVPLCIFAFIASHAVGQGAVIWTFISEIFPNQHRAAGQALGTGTHWVFAALITFLFPIMVKAVPTGYIFAFFAFMMVLQLLWVKLMVPETKGKTLEELGSELRLGKQ